MRAETESDGGGGAGSLHLVEWLKASMEPPQHTKLTLCKISGVQQEGPTAIFSQSETVCFLWVLEPECVRREGMPAEQEDVLGSTTGGGARPPPGWAAELRGFLTS